MLNCAYTQDRPELTRAQHEVRSGVPLNPFNTGPGATLRMALHMHIYLSFSFIFNIQAIFTFYIAYLIFIIINY